MMERLFCFSVFGRKSKARTCGDGREDSKSSDSHWAKTVATDKPPFLQMDTANRLVCKDGKSQTDVDKGEGACFTNEPCPCKLQIHQGSVVGMSLSSAMSRVLQDTPYEEALTHHKEAISNGQGWQEVSAPQIVCDWFPESTEKSDTGALELEFADSSKHCPRDGVATHVNHATGPTEKVIFSKDFSEDRLDLLGVLEEARRDAIFRYSPENAIMAIKCEKCSWDDGALGGHASDPGLYQGDEMQSSNGFSVLQDDGSVMHPLLMEGSPNPGSHVSGDVAENLSVETCGHCSEPTHRVVEVIDPRPDDGSVGHFSRSMTCMLNLEASSKTSPVHEEIHEERIGHISRFGEESSSSCKIALTTPKLRDGFSDAEGAGAGIFTVALKSQSLSTDVPSAESSLSRVKEWISTIQQPDVPLNEPMAASVSEIEEAVDSSRGLPNAVSMDQELANVAIRNLSAFSTVAHMAGIGLREVPSLGVFNCLKTLNLSANSITRILTGYLPQSLHTLDLSRNRISQIEGFRDLTRLRVLNLSYNKISRIGHGLSNCTLIKELYLAGNKIAEVDGLHRLLKLSVLDLSENKVATSKALGQLAANYGSLLALNLLRNPILVNVGEDQLRKLVSCLTPHVTYLNKQPIKAVSVREAAVDNVARAALGTTQRTGKTSRKIGGVQASATSRKKLPSHSAKDVEKRQGLGSGRSSRHQHHSHHHREGSSIEPNGKGPIKDQGYAFETAFHENLLQYGGINASSQSMHPSKSDGSFQVE